MVVPRILQEQILEEPILAMAAATGAAAVGPMTVQEAAAAAVVLLVILVTEAAVQTIVDHQEQAVLVAEAQVVRAGLLVYKTTLVAEAVAAELVY